MAAVCSGIPVCSDVAHAANDVIMGVGIFLDALTALPAFWSMNPMLTTMAYAYRPMNLIHQTTRFFEKAIYGMSAILHRKCRF